MKYVYDSPSPVKVPVPSFANGDIYYHILAVIICKIKENICGFAPGVPHLLKWDQNPVF
jgi:hypothetical protein